MIYLDKDTAFKNAKTAYQEGRLQAQQASQEGQLCLYSGPCAIGISLPDLPIRYNEFTTLQLVSSGVVATNDITAIQDLQSAHDQWQQTRNVESELDFVRLLL